MSHFSARLLYWSPRVLGVAYAIFLSIFALDVYSETHGLLQTGLALMLHLIPTMVVLVILIVGWRWEWIGEVLFALAAAAYMWRVLPRHVDWAAGIAGPPLLITALFLVSWSERARVRAALQKRNLMPNCNCRSR